MRRNIIAIAASVIMGMAATSAMAQAPVSTDYGVKAGVNFSGLALSNDFHVLKSQMKPGADFGGFMRINLQRDRSKGRGPPCIFGKQDQPMGDADPHICPR